VTFSLTSARVLAVAVRPTHSPTLKRTRPRRSGVAAAQRLQRAHQRRRALKLVEREQPQGVAQQHRHPVAAVGSRAPAQAAQHQGKGDHPEVRLGLAAARREEDELDHVAVGVRRVVEARHVEQQEGELKQPPSRRRWA
jgi:hypothetical protein